MSRDPDVGVRWPLRVYLATAGRLSAVVCVSEGDGQRERREHSIAARAAGLARQSMTIPTGRQVRLQLLERKP